MHVQFRKCLPIYALRMFSPRDLEAFVAVIDAGSVNAAAQGLFRTQPTVSRQLAALERRIGARLFRRTPSGMVLTEAGERLEPMARDLVLRSRRADAVMDAVSSGAPSFVVACPEMTAMLLVAPFIAAGGAVSDVLPAHPAAVYGKLKAGADVAVNTSPPPPGLRGVPLATLRILCQVTPQHPLAGRDRVELEDVVGEPFVVPGRGSSVWTAVQQAAEGDGLSLVMATETSNAPLAQASSAAGKGAALVLEPPQFGLVSRPLVHRGRALTSTFYAAWERGHYAGEDLLRLASALAEFMLSTSHDLAFDGAMPAGS